AVSAGREDEDAAVERARVELSAGGIERERRDLDIGVGSGKTPPALRAVSRFEEARGGSREETARHEWFSQEGVDRGAGGAGASPLRGGPSGEGREHTAVGPRVDEVATGGVRREAPDNRPFELAPRRFPGLAPICGFENAAPRRRRVEDVGIPRIGGEGEGKRLLHPGFGGQPPCAAVRSPEHPAARGREGHLLRRREDREQGGRRSESPAPPAGDAAPDRAARSEEDLTGAGRKGDRVDLALLGSRLHAPPRLAAVFGDLE